jgi:thiamine-monophosphate kinase
MVKHKGNGPGEPEFIEKLGRRIRLPFGSGVIAGIGDDCAILRPRGSAEDLLFTTDLLIEGTHFLRGTHRPEDAGHKALARGLSDIAAMGGTPRFALLSLALAPWCKPRWVDRFYDGLLALSDASGAPLIGGDLAVTDRFSCDIVVAGALPRGAALRRNGARPGDTIYVSGRLGGSALGLATRRGPAWARHKRPEPRLALGRYLREKVKASAAMDLSDGLSLDLYRLAAASGLRAEITEPPRFPGATLEQALHGGEDYELVFTAPPRARVPSEFEGIPLTPIGRMHRGKPGLVTLDGVELPRRGWDHLR